MLGYGYSITLIHWLPLVDTRDMHLTHRLIQSNYRGLHTSKILEIPKGRTILSWGRLYHNKPKTTKIKLRLQTIEPPQTQAIQNTNQCVNLCQQSIPIHHTTTMVSTFVPYITPTNPCIIYMF